MFSWRVQKTTLSLVFTHIHKFLHHDSSSFVDNPTAFVSVSENLKLNTSIPSITTFSPETALYKA
jgi:hypothetical protein